MGAAMTTKPKPRSKIKKPAKPVAHEDLLRAQVRADPELAEEWERLALARHVAVELIRYRAENGLSQRDLAARLGVSQPRVVELESGEKNPQFETLAHLVAVTGIEFALSFARSGEDHKLVGKAVKAGGAHAYRGASVLVASR
ncbi:MAG TPA: helix-turn-helix transcriptional regulator [Solirubrobacteraceae bacterium]|nr:helix-turn-helix transcriptional regulator [Solirubrobacteraceae bacterium]